MATKKVRVTQTRSTIRHPKDQLATLQGLGLRRIGSEVEHEVTPSIVGMLKKVSHLVKVKEV